LSTRSFRLRPAVWLPLVLVGCIFSGDDDPAAGPAKAKCAKEPCSQKPGDANTACKNATDCNSAICQAGACTEATPTDGVKNGGESDVDCGGAAAPKCAPDKKCTTADDCDSAICTASVCAAPSPTDGVKNGGESDIDCGGPNAPKCDAGKACEAHTDCSSDGCGYEKKCVEWRSCTAHFGGDTCGPGEVGEADAKHESCCVSIALGGGGSSLDKYTITAGRMRAFVERLNGDIKTFVAGLEGNADWNQAWTARMPSTVDEVHVELGPSGTDGDRQGCYNAGNGAGGAARTYWMSAEASAALGDEVPHKYTQEVLDPKGLNCATFFMLQAFCIWDGGRLATIGELNAQWAGTYPWGNAPGPDADHVVHNFNYGWPEDRLENTAYVAAPGRKPAGNGPKGHADLGGLLFNITSSVETVGSVTGQRWSRNGSWEVHGVPYGAHASPATRAYEAAGGRCTKK
jgi:hypothetical protein